MTTRKAPSGVKHARCIDHVPHSYPTSGWLCIGTREPGRAADMVAFADHLAGVVVARRASRLAELAIPSTGKVAGEPTCTDGNTKYNATIGGSGCAFSSVHHHGMGGSPITRSAEEREAFARLSAQLNEIKGRPAAAPTVEPTPAPVRKARASRVSAPVQVVVDSVVIAEARHVDPCAGAGRVLTLVYANGRIGGAERAGMERCPVCDRLVLVTLTGDPSEARIALHYAAEPTAERNVEPEPVELCPAEAGGYLTCTRPAGHSGKHDGPAPMLPGAPCGMYLHTQGGPIRCALIDGHVEPCDYPRAEPAPDTYAAALAMAETRPDPCAECGHPAHGATCATCDDAAQVGTYAPCTVIEPVQAPGEPIAAPAPVLSAPSARPTCERCGQTFRKSGNGAEWHRVNRPDCASIAAAV